MIKSLETVGRVTHTHTQPFLDNEIASIARLLTYLKIWRT